ncbi:MAG: hypothetical protein KAI82_14300 [Tritonibacter mobilis]|nr:hypothetical protein [Tritonibacter mobilis]
MSSRSVQVRLHDTHIGIWQDDPNDPTFRDEIYSGLIRLMRKRGWSVREDPKIKKHYPILNSSHRLAAKGPLRASVEISGRVVKAEIWSVNARQNNQAGRRYDFGKLKRMPFLDKKRFELEKKALLSWLDDLCSVEVSDANTASLTTDQFIAKSYKDSWHTDQSTGHPICRSDYNRKSADGELLEHGQTVWFAGRDGRIRRGQAFYNINNMWWVKISQTERTNLCCSELYAQVPKDLRAKVNQRQRRKRLEQLLSSAVRRSDYLRAHKLQSVLFGAEQVYRIWSRKKDAFYSACGEGYSSDGISAGRFTLEKAEAEVKRVPHILSLVSPDGKHVRFDQAA